MSRSHRTAIAVALATGACSPSAATERGDELLPGAVVERTAIWEDLPFAVAGCTVQRLVTPKPLALFEWAPCKGQDRCSEAVWQDEIIGEDGEIGRRTSVDDDGRTVRIAVRYDSDVAQKAGVIVAREDGAIELGLRTSTAGPCNMNVPSVGHARFGVLVTRTASAGEPVREGGLLAPLDELATLTPFELEPMPPGSGPDEAAMGPSRWLWRFAPDQLLTVSSVDGTDPTVFAQRSSAILALGGPTAIGEAFLFEAIERTGDGALQGSIQRSDGATAPISLIAGSPDAWVGAPMFAHSHLGWQRGIGPTRLGAFDRVELWASRLAEDSTALEPYEVGELPAKGWSSIGAGWGRYATTGALPNELLLWDLEENRSTSIVLPADHAFAACPGVTRSALWVVPELRTSPRRGLLRFACG
ncbi:MAG: hypothetical protein IAG13_02015 [Deltaproteobacteria bacterium]|nr:hypothetical protein [Nannocystaceae bacterium]